MRMEAALTYGYRLYRGAEFCRLETGMHCEQWAIDDAYDHVSSGNYTRAEVTCNGAVIGNINNKLEYTRNGNN